MIDVYYIRRLFKDRIGAPTRGVMCDQKKKYSFGHAVEFTDIIYFHCPDVSYWPDLNSGATRIKSWTI